MSEIICPMCRGRGEDVEIECDNCHGTGYDPNEDNALAQCHSCSGDGTVEVDICPHCNGEGKIEKEEEEEEEEEEE
jgi:DnaJ-class molecular chaperone